MSRKVHVGRGRFDATSSDTGPENAQKLACMINPLKKLVRMKTFMAITVRPT